MRLVMTISEVQSIPTDGAPREMWLCLMLRNTDADLQSQDALGS